MRCDLSVFLSCTSGKFHHLFWWGRLKQVSGLQETCGDLSCSLGTPQQQHHDPFGRPTEELALFIAIWVTPYYTV